MPNIQQSGERVMRSLSGEFLLQCPVGGHVPEAPDPTDGLVAQQLGPAVAFEDPPIPELDQVAALGTGVGIEFAHAGELQIAYRIVERVKGVEEGGDAPLTIVMVSGALFPIEVMWDEPGVARLLDGT